MSKITKKLLAIGLATLLLTGAMSVMMVSAAPFVSQDLFVGGDIEGATDTSWGEGNTFEEQPKTNAVMTSSVENEIVHTGNKSIKLVANADNPSDDAGNPAAYIMGRVPNYTDEGSIAEIRAFVNITDLAEGAYAYVRMYAGGTQKNKRYGNPYTFSALTNGWKEIYIPLYEARTQSNLYVSFELHGAGTMYIDDLTIKTTDSLVPTDFGAWYFEAYYRDRSNGYPTDAENYEGSRGMFVGSGSGTTSTKNGAYFMNWAKPVTGEKYRLSYRFKPVTGADGNPTIPASFIIGDTTDISNSQLIKVLDSWDILLNPLYGDVVKGNLENGWQEYHAYFTMTMDKAAPEYIGYLLNPDKGQGTDGYYDSFYLAKDYEEEVTIINDNFEEVEIAKPGDKILVKKHVISDKTEAQGGKTVSLVLASYETVGDKKVLKDVKIEDKTVYDGVKFPYSVCGAADVMLEHTVTEDEVGYTLKAFCWDSTASLKTVDPADSITVVAK